MKELKGPLLLLCAAFIWGSSFIVMKNAVDFLTPAVLLFVRFSMASLILSFMFFKKIKNVSKEKIKGGLLTGCCLFFAYYVQTCGLALTTPGKNAFLTAVYCAIVPFLVWIVYRQKPDIYHFVAAFVCVIGIGFVSLNGDLSVNVGDLLTLAGGFLYAIHILMIQRFSKDVDGGDFTAFQFIGGTCIALIFAILFEDITLVSQIHASIFLQIFYLAFFATAMTMLCQTVGQKLTNECHASLILSLESVFGVFFSILFHYEVLTHQVMIGFVLIFIAVVIAETKLSFLKNNKIIKRFLSILFVFIILCSSLQKTYAMTSLNLNSKYAYLIDPQTDIVYLDQGSEERIYPASMTKVLTVSLALEHIDNLHQEVQIEQIDLEGLFEAGASVAGFYVGEKVTYEDLLYGALLPSGADACYALARLTCGSKEKFVEAMNDKLKELHLENSHFVNPTGLHDNQHYTTAKDMSIILEYALQNPQFVKIFEARTYESSHKNHQWASCLKRAEILKDIHTDVIDGAKSGFTDEAELTLASTMTIDSHQLIFVSGYAVGQRTQNHIKDALNVYDYMKNQYHQVTLYKKDDDIQTYWILYTFQNPYVYKMPEDLSVLVERHVTLENIEASIQTKSFLKAPVEKQTQLGTIQISNGQQVIYEYQMILSQDIPLQISAVISFYGIIFVLVLIVIYFIYRVKKHKKR